MGADSNIRKKESQQKNRNNSKNKKQNKSKISKMDLTKSNQSKKIWSFDTLVEVMKPSTEELEYREEKAKDTNFVEKYSKLFKCTKCQLSIKPIIVKHKKVPVHPCLGVLMCQKCCDYYEDGEFSLDSDGEDKYCRWCGEGGTIFSCSQCICGFCAACIKLHFKAEYIKQVQKDENWLCFFCNPKPLWDLRFTCSLAIKMSESSFRKNEDSVTQNEDTDNTDVGDKQETAAGSPRRGKLLVTKKRDLSGSSAELKDFTGESTEESHRLSICVSSSEESDSETPVKKVRYTSTPLERPTKNVKTESFKNRKSNALKELKKILTLAEHQMDFGVTWSRKMLDQMAAPDCIQTNTRLVKECQKVKQFLSVLSTFLVQYINSVDSVEKTLSKNDGKIVQCDSVKDQSAYTNILQFLGFIRGQVKAFMEKGISLSDILEAEVYDDEKIIGIFKKTNSSSTPSQSKSKASSCGISSSFKSNSGTESRENSENNRIDELEKIREDDILELVANQTLQKEDFDMDDEYEFKNQDSSNTTLGELNDTQSTTCPKDDIRDILAILENA